MSKKGRSNDTWVGRLGEQIADFWLRFALSTLLVGGTGYLLFQLPQEKKALDGELLKLSNLATEIKESPLNELGTVFTTELASGSPMHTRRDAVLSEIVKGIGVDQLDSSFERDTLNWISEATGKLENEKGRLNGFSFANESERWLQQETVAVLNGQVAVLNGIQDMILNWTKERPTGRMERLVTLERLRQQNAGRLEGLASRAMQMARQTKIEQSQVDQKFADWKPRYRSSDVSNFFSESVWSLASALLVS